MTKGTRSTPPRSTWRVVRATVEVAVLSPDFSPYTDRDLRRDLTHLVGGGQLNRRNARFNYKVSFGAVQVKEAWRLVPKLQRELLRKAEERKRSISDRVEQLRRDAT